MDRTLDYFLAIAALIIGGMLLTGNGGIFMKGGNEQLRSQLYDEKKLEKASGLAMIGVGIATGINAFTTGLEAKLIYIAVLLVIFCILFYYMRTKCKK